MIRYSDLTKNYYSSGDVAKLLGVVPMTVIGYDNKGIMKFERTTTNRRIISKVNLIKYLETTDFYLNDVDNVKYDAIYCRVSTHKQAQRGDLDNQINTVLAYVATQNPVNLKIYKDIGSGLNDKRKDLLNLVSEVQRGRVNRIFITYKDRLTRFGFNYLQEICKFHNTSVIPISNEILEKSIQEELVEDLIAIIHSFSGKLYGLRKSQLKEINKSIETISVEEKIDE